MTNRLEKVKERRTFLYENQPHDHEWDCPYEEIEYFLLNEIFCSRFTYIGSDIDSDKNIYENMVKIDSPFLALSDLEIIEVVNLLSRKLKNEQIKIKLTSLQKELFSKLKEDCYEYLNESYEYNMSKFNISDVLNQAIVYLLQNYKNKSFNPHYYPYKSLWNDLKESSRTEFLVDYPVSRSPESKEDGWLKVSISNGSYNEISFAYWNINSFEDQIKEKIIAWKEITSCDMDQYIEFTRKNSIGSFNRAKAVKSFLKLKKIKDNYDD